MSERGEIAVEMPVTAAMATDREEYRAVLRQAFVEARKLAATVDGVVLGVVKTATIERDGSPFLRWTFAVDAPEETWHRRKSFAVS